MIEVRKFISFLVSVIIVALPVAALAAGATVKNDRKSLNGPRVMAPVNLAILIQDDLVSHVSNELDILKWTFVPVDLTVGLYRQPVGPWVGMSSRTTIGTEGIGQTTTIAFDETGKVGQSIHTLFVRPR